MAFPPNSPPTDSGHRGFDQGDGQNPSPRIVVLVDDEASIRVLAGHILRRNGFTVLEASNGMEALRILKSTPSVQLLISDVEMPEMRGTELSGGSHGNPPRPEDPSAFRVYRRQSSSSRSASRRIRVSGQTFFSGGTDAARTADSGLAPQRVTPVPRGRAILGGSVAGKRNPTG